MPSEIPPKLDSVPPVPPPMPPSVRPVIAEQPMAGRPVLEGRLHPLTLVILLVNSVRNFILPAIVVFLVSNKSTGGFILLAFLVVTVLQTLTRYFTFTYRIEGGELITRHGILERTERHIPLTRVQDLRIEQGILHRLLKVVDLHVETAGGKGAEASLSVLSRDEAENLRRAVFEQTRTLAQTTGAEASAPLPAAPDEIVRRLSTRELVLAGLTSNRTASALVVVAVAWQLLDDILPKQTYERLLAAFSSQVEHWIEPGGHTNWIAIAATAVGVILVGLVFSVAGSIVLFHGFTLSRRGEDLHRAYGLFTRRASSLPRRRIQLLKIEETWLRRLFGLATLRADTAGSQPANPQENHDGRDVLLPVVRREELETVLPVVFPGVESDPHAWRQVSRRAIRRGTLKGAMICGLFTIAALLFERDVFGLWPLVFIPLVYALNVASYRHLGYALGERFFRTRRGWLSRATHLVPIGNAQTIVLKQTPFDRRHGVMTLVVDTAGQAHTGGGPHIRNVPVADAEVVARLLAQRAAQTRYRW
jgi:putative membrane protein